MALQGQQMFAYFLRSVDSDLSGQDTILACCQYGHWRCAHFDFLKSLFFHPLDQNSLQITISDTARTPTKIHSFYSFINRFLIFVGMTTDRCSWQNTLLGCSYSYKWPQDMALVKQISMRVCWRVVLSLVCPIPLPTLRWNSHFWPEKILNKLWFLNLKKKGH